MADYLVPEGWKFDGSANNGNQTTFKLPGHTVANPYMAIFDRRVPQVVNGSFTTPSYRVRVIRGFSDAEGNPLSTRCVIDCNIRWPFGATNADVMSAVGVMGTLLSDALLQDDIVVEQLLPTEVTPTV